MGYPKCGLCKERPAITEDGTFWCGVTGEWKDDEDIPCEYYEEN